MSEEVSSVSQNEESPIIEKDAETEALFAQFDLKPKSAKKEIQFPGVKEPSVDPAIDQKTEDVSADVKKSVKVKFNKEEVEIEEGQVPELLQKGLALDKERERKNELEKTLDRAAKLAGFENHSDYIANLDKLEQQQQQKKQDDFDKLKSDMRQEFIDSGFDPDKVDAYIETHPLMQKAREAVQKDEERAAQETLTKMQEQNQKAWQELYKEFPSIVESSQLFNEGKEPDWYNADMKSRIAKGYDPLDAYRLAHLSTIQTVNRKQADQAAIKAQQLGTRAAATGSTAQIPDEPTLLPQQIALAQEFGVSVAGVTRHQKLLDSRRK